MLYGVLFIELFYSNRAFPDPSCPQALFTPTPYTPNPKLKI